MLPFTAYPISLAIVVVNDAIGLKKESGMLDELPMTNMTAIVSPTARPTPRIIADMMPERAAGSMTRNTV